MLSPLLPHPCYTGVFYCVRGLETCHHIPYPGQPMLKDLAVFPPTSLLPVLGWQPSLAGDFSQRPSLCLGDKTAWRASWSSLELMGEKNETTRLNFTKMNFQIFHFDPYFSSMAVLNFSTLSSLRSWAASLPFFSSLSTTCLQSSLADGRFVMSGYSSDWGSKERKTFFKILFKKQQSAKERVLNK